MFSETVCWKNRLTRSFETVPVTRIFGMYPSAPAPGLDKLPIFPFHAVGFASRLPSCFQDLSKSKRLTESDGCPAFAPAYVAPKTTLSNALCTMTHCYLLIKHNGGAAPGLFGRVP